MKEDGGNVEKAMVNSNENVDGSSVEDAGRGRGRRGGGGAARRHHSFPAMPCKLPLSRVTGILEKVGVPALLPRIMCLFCERTFLSRVLLQKHTERSHRIPSGRRASARIQEPPPAPDYHPGCNMCSKNTATTNTASNLPALFQHLVETHAHKYFACRICKLRFSNDKLLASHNMTLHPTHNRTDVHSDINDQVTCLTVQTSSSLQIENDAPCGVNVKINSSTKRVTLNLPSENSKTVLPSDNVKKHKKGKEKTKCQKPKTLNSLNNPITPDTGQSVSKNILQTETSSANTNGLQDFEDDILANLIIPSQIRDKNQPNKSIFNQKEISTENADRKLMKVSNASVSIARLQIKPDSSDTQVLSRLGLTQNRTPRAQNLRRSRRTPLTESRASSEVSRKEKLKNKNEGNEFVISKNKNDPGVKFDPDFYSKVSSNVRENLLNHLDGKLGKTNTACDVPDIIDPKIKSTHAVMESTVEQPAEIHGSDVNLNAITVFPTLLTSDQYGSDKIPHYSYGAKVQSFKKIITKNSWKWKWDPIKKYKYCNEDGKIVRKIRPIQHTSPRDLSKLDLWTQLTMREKYDTCISNKESGSSTEEDKNRCERQKQIKELNVILDSRVFPDIESECNMSSSVVATNEGEDEQKRTIDEQQGNSEKDQTESEPSGDMLLAGLGLVRGQSNEASTSGVLSGEWARPRCYVCCVCGRRTDCLRLLEAHQASQHPHVHATHYELVGKELLQTQLYKHLYLPGNKKGHATIDKNKIRKQTIARHIKNIPRKFLSINQSTRILRTTTRNIKSQERECTKCKKMLLPSELYKHILECAGDYGWIMAKKKCKYKPFGARRRRLKGLYKRERPQDDSEKSEVKERTVRPKLPARPRSKPSDAETIQRMLANLPPKRASRQILNLPSPKIRPYITSKNKQGHIVRRIVPNPSIQRNKVMNKSTTIITTIKNGISKKLRRVTRSIANTTHNEPNPKKLKEQIEEEDTEDSPSTSKRSKLKTKKSTFNSDVEENSNLPDSSHLKKVSKIQVTKKRHTSSTSTTDIISSGNKNDLGLPTQEKKTRHRNLSKNGVSSAVVKKHDIKEETKSNIKRILRRRTVSNGCTSDKSKLVKNVSNKPVSINEIEGSENISEDGKEMSDSNSKETFKIPNSIDEVSQPTIKNKKKTVKKIFSFPLKWIGKKKTQSAKVKRKRNIDTINIKDTIESDNDLKKINDLDKIISVGSEIIDEELSVNNETSNIIALNTDNNGCDTNKCENVSKISEENTNNELESTNISNLASSTESSETKLTDIIQNNTNVTENPISADMKLSIITVSDSNYTNLCSSNFKSHDIGGKSQTQRSNNHEFTTNLNQVSSKINQKTVTDCDQSSKYSLSRTLQNPLPYGYSEKSSQFIQSLCKADEFQLDNIDKPPLFSSVSAHNLHIMQEKRMLSTSLNTFNLSDVSISKSFEHNDTSSGLDTDSGNKNMNKIKNPKSRRGLNDCIAMLKGKLIDKVCVIPTEKSSTTLPTKLPIIAQQSIQDDDNIQPLDLSGRCLQAKDLTVCSQAEDLSASCPHPQDLSLGNSQVQDLSMKTSQKNNLNNKTLFQNILTNPAVLTPVRKPVFDPTLRIPQYPISNVGMTSSDKTSSKIVSKPVESNQNKVLPQDTLCERNSIIPALCSKTNLTAHSKIDLPSTITHELSLLPQTLANTIEKLPPLHREEIVKVLPQVLAKAVENLNLMRADISSKHIENNPELKQGSNQNSALCDKTIAVTPSISDNSTADSLHRKLFVLPQTSEISTQTILSNKVNEEIKTSVQECPPEFLNVNTDLFLIDPISGMITKRKIEEKVEVEKSPSSLNDLLNEADKCQTITIKPNIADDIIDLTDDRNSPINENKIPHSLDKIEIKETDSLITKTISSENCEKLNEIAQTDINKKILFETVKSSVEKGTTSLRAVRIKSTSEKLKAKSVANDFLASANVEPLKTFAIPSEFKLNEKNDTKENIDITEEIVQSKVESAISSSKDSTKNMVNECLDIGLPSDIVEPAIQQDEVSSTQHHTVDDSSDIPLISSAIPIVCSEEKCLKDQIESSPECVFEEFRIESNDKTLITDIEKTENIENSKSERILRNSRKCLDSSSNSKILENQDVENECIVANEVIKKKTISKKKKSIKEVPKEKKNFDSCKKLPKSIVKNSDSVKDTNNKHSNSLDENADEKINSSDCEQSKTTSFNKLLLKENNTLSETALTPSNVIDYKSERKDDKCNSTEINEIIKEDVQTKNDTNIRRSMRKNKCKSSVRESERKLEKNIHFQHSDNCNDLDLNPDVSGAAIIPGESCKANLGKIELSPSLPTKHADTDINCTVKLAENVESDDDDDICLADVAKKKSQPQEIISPEISIDVKDSNESIKKDFKKLVDTECSVNLVKTKISNAVSKATKKIVKTIKKKSNKKPFVNLKSEKKVIPLKKRIIVPIIEENSTETNNSKNEPNIDIRKSTRLNSLIQELPPVNDGKIASIDSVKLNENGHLIFKMHKECKDEIKVDVCNKNDSSSISEYTITDREAEVPNFTPSETKKVDNESLNSINKINHIIASASVKSLQDSNIDKSSNSKSEGQLIIAADSTVLQQHEKENISDSKEPIPIDKKINKKPFYKKSAAVLKRKLNKPKNKKSLAAMIQNVTDDENEKPLIVFKKNALLNTKNEAQSLICVEKDHKIKNVKQNNKQPVSLNTSVPEADSNVVKSSNVIKKDISVSRDTYHSELNESPIENFDKNINKTIDSSCKVIQDCVLTLDSKCDKSDLKNTSQDNSSDEDIVLCELLPKQKPRVTKKKSIIVRGSKSKESVNEIKNKISSTEQQGDPPKEELPFDTKTNKKAGKISSKATIVVSKRSSETNFESIQTEDKLPSEIIKPVSSIDKKSKSNRKVRKNNTVKNQSQEMRTEINSIDDTNQNDLGQSTIKESTKTENTNLYKHKLKKQKRSLKGKIDVDKLTSALALESHDISENKSLSQIVKEQSGISNETVNEFVIDVKSNTKECSDTDSTIVKEIHNTLKSINPELPLCQNDHQAIESPSLNNKVLSIDNDEESKLHTENDEAETLVKTAVMSKKKKKQQTRESNKDILNESSIIKNLIEVSPVKSVIQNNEVESEKCTKTKLDKTDTKILEDVSDASVIKFIGKKNKCVKTPKHASSKVFSTSKNDIDQLTSMDKTVNACQEQIIDKEESNVKDEKADSTLVVKETRKNRQNKICKKNDLPLDNNSSNLIKDKSIQLSSKDENKNVGAMENAPLNCIAMVNNVSKISEQEINNDKIEAKNSPVKVLRISQRRRTLATCESLENDLSIQSNEADINIQDKYLANFGMFTEKRPRKSTLVAIKKISQAFKPETEASDSEDTENNTNKKKTQHKNTEKTSTDQELKNDIAENDMTSENENSFKRLPLFDESSTSQNFINNQSSSVNVDDGSISIDESSSTGKESKIQGNTKTENYCSICKRKFRRPENLLKHKMTLMHISRLSEIEAKEMECKVDNKSIDDSNEETVNKNIILSEFVDDTPKSVENLTRVYKNLAERKSFDNENIAADADNITENVQSLETDKSLLIPKETDNECLSEINVDLSRKTLSCDEALFFECCSLLKESKTTRKEVNIIETTVNQKITKTYPNINESILEPPPIEFPNQYNSGVKNILKASEIIPLGSLSSDNENAIEFPHLASRHNLNTNVNDERPFTYPNNVESNIASEDIHSNYTNIQLSQSSSPKKLSSERENLFPSNDVIPDQIFDRQIIKDVNLCEDDISTNLAEATSLDLEQKSNNEFDPYLAESLMVRTNSDDFSDNGDSLISSQDTEQNTVQTNTRKNQRASDKINNHIDVINEFEDKFDKIKRKAREKAQAAQEAMAAVISVRTSKKSTKKTNSKSRKTTEKKVNQEQHPKTQSNKSSSSKQNEVKKRNLGTPTQKITSKKVLTKGALKGFDGVKVSISSEEINFHDILDNTKLNSQDYSSTKTKNTKTSIASESSTSERFSESDNKHIDRNMNTKTHFSIFPKKSEQKNISSKLNSSDSNRLENSFKSVSNNKQLDIYEFFDDEDDNTSDNFKFRTPTTVNKLNLIKKNDNSNSALSINVKNNLESQNDDSQISSLSFSDRDDFTYMSDDYIANESEEETNHSSNSIDGSGNISKINKKHKKLAKQRNIKKSAIMGKIFKNNAIRNDQNTSMHDIIDNSNDVLSGHTDMDQLFNSLFDQTITSNTDNIMPRNKSPCDVSDTDDIYSAGDDGQSGDNKLEPNIRSPSLCESDSDNDESNENPIRPYPRASQRKIVPRLKARSSDDESILKPHPQSIEISGNKNEIGVASHKSQRKCTTGKQNVLVESWSSESDFEDFRQFEEYSSIPRSQRHHRRPRRSGRHRQMEENKVSVDQTTDRHVESSDSSNVIRFQSTMNDIDRKENKERTSSENGRKRQYYLDQETESPTPKHHASYSEIQNKTTQGSTMIGRRVSFNTSNSISKGRSSRRKRRQSQKPFDYDDEFKPARIAEPLATQRRNKRAASEMLYYWSSSSDDDVQNASADINSRDQEPIEQHGWIVGDSHKKLVTMLAHAKGRKLDDNSTVKEKKSRLST